MLQRLGIKDRRDLAVLAGLILLVAITPLGSEGTHPAVLLIYRSLLIAIVAMYAAWTDRSKLPRLCPYFAGTLVALTGITILSIVRWSGSLFEGAYNFYANVLFVAAFVALAHAGTGRATQWKNTVLTSVVLINIAYLISAIAIGGTVLQGPFVNPNYFASFLIPGLAICAATVLARVPMIWRGAAAAAGLFLFYGIGRTASRGATLAALGMLSLAVLRVALRFGVSRIRIVVVTILLLTLIGGATVAINPVLVRKFLDRGEHDPYNYQRGQIWLGTASMIAQYPLTGVGLGHYYYIAKLFTPSVDGAIAHYRKWPNIAHSEYLQYIAEIGIPGALLLFATGGYLFYLIWRRAGKMEPGTGVAQEAALLTAVGLGTHALVDNNWTVPVMAIALAVISQADLLPFRNGVRIRMPSPLWRVAAALLFIGVWIGSTAVPAAGLYLNELGHQAHNAGNFEAAVANHRFALALLPTHPVLLDNLGIVYFDQFLKTRKGVYLDLAEIYFAESMEQNPHFDLPAGHLETALIQRLTGNMKFDAPIHRKIVAADRHGLAANPFNPFIRKNLAEGLYNLGQKKEACEELRKAVELEPNYVPGYLRLAEWYEEMGQHGESAEYRQHAIQLVNYYKDKRTLDDFEDLLLGRPKSVRQ
jgi:O-antigen ligase